MEEYITVKELCERLNVTKVTVSHWIKQGKIKYLKIGKAVRIPTSQFKQMEGN